MLHETRILEEHQGITVCVYTLIISHDTGEWLCASLTPATHLLLLMLRKCKVISEEKSKLYIVKFCQFSAML